MIYLVRHDTGYIGGTTLVVAESEERAVALTKFELTARGLIANQVYVDRSIDTDKESCTLIDDGDY
jgi:hypothetical protein